MNRRHFLSGMAGILASGFAPAVVGSGVLMPVRRVVHNYSTFAFDGFVYVPISGHTMTELWEPLTW